MPNRLNLPRTLLDFAGVSASPGDASPAVLLMIDPQREYTTGRLPLAGVGAAVEEGARLLAFARANDMPVFHAIHHARPGAALFDPHQDGAQFIPALAPAPDETVVVKS